MKVKVFTLFHQISEHLCAVDWRACPMYHFSAGLEGTRWTKWKWKFCHHICICLLTFLRISVLDTVLRTKVLVRWFNKFKLSSLLLQSKNIRQTSRKKIILLDSAAAHLYNNIQWHTKYTCLQSIPNTPQGHLTMEQHPLDFSRASAVSAASIR